MKGAKKGEWLQTKSVFKGDDGYLRSGKIAIHDWWKRFGTYKAKEMRKGHTTSIKKNLEIVKLLDHVMMV